MPLTTRPLTRDDFDQSVALIREAFGDLPPGATPPSADDFPRPGYHAFGTFDDGHLVARVVTREYHSWFGGSAVPTGGIAGVAVAAERRGEKLLDDLFRVVLDDGLRERGEAVSTLFCTAPGSTASSATSWSPPTTRSRSPQQRWPGSVPRPVCAPAGRRPPTSTRSARCTTPGRPRRTACSRAAARRSRPMPGLSSTRSPGSRSRSTTRATCRLRELAARPGVRRLLDARGLRPARAERRRLRRPVARARVVRQRGRPGAAVYVGQRRGPAVAPVCAWEGRGAGAVHAARARRARRFAGRDWPVDGVVAFSVAGDHVGTTNGASLGDRAGEGHLRAGGGGRRSRPGTRRARAGPAGAKTCANLRAGHLSGGMENDEALDRVLVPRPIHIRDYF